MKGATIEKLKEPSTKIIYSLNKTWKSYQFGLFEGRTEYNDLNYGILHMIQLRLAMEERNWTNLIVERGISDFTFYHYYNDLKQDPEIDFVTSLVSAERNLLLPDFLGEAEKILLIQKDQNFVKDIVLKDEYRKRTFNNNPDLYFELQEKYVEFTKKFNDISEIIEITNAKDYIINVLGTSWNEV